MTYIMQVSVNWKRCARLPGSLCGGQTIVISGKVYCGGGVTGDDNECIVHCYDPPQDKWTTLPPLPVRWFGLGQVNGKLVAVGGEKGASLCSDVCTYDERS